ncbi:MAG: carboxypeptidase-like regulatory domain-containing protein [Acidobacteriia bacterium]|nr:carboxypeptidase-like regulatory domain-containing protein [Terriglobia bacterium]
MSPSLFRRAMSSVLVVAIALLVADLPALAGSNAVFRGRVLDADGVSPRPGVVVTLVDESGRKTFDSAPADARGYFRIDAAPAGTYAVVARASEGAFLAASSLTLDSGSNKPLALALKAGAGGGGEAPRRDKISGWLKWAIVGGIAVGALIVADAITKEETPASPL